MDEAGVCGEIAPRARTESTFRRIKPVNLDVPPHRARVTRPQREGQIVDIGIQVIPEQDRAQAGVCFRVEAWQGTGQLFDWHPQCLAQPDEMTAVEIGLVGAEPEGDRLAADSDATRQFRPRPPSRFAKSLK